MSIISSASGSSCWRGLDYYKNKQITNIKKINDFEYTTPEQTPELILQVTDVNKDEVTDIPGLIYNEELKGFDITMAVGSFIVANNKEISVIDDTVDADYVKQFNANIKITNAIINA